MHGMNAFKNGVCKRNLRDCSEKIVLQERQVRVRGKDII